MDNIHDLFTLGCSIAVIFGGLVPYIPQYLTIKRTNDTEGFSTYVCLTLLLANILRILFWFGDRFELPLLIQSFVMIAAMLAMMEICVRVRDKYTPEDVISPVGTMASRSRRPRLIGKMWPWRSLRVNASITEAASSTTTTTTEDQSDFEGSPDENSPIYSLPSSSTTRRELISSIPTPESELPSPGSSEDLLGQVITTEPLEQNQQNQTSRTTKYFFTALTSTNLLKLFYPSKQRNRRHPPGLRAMTRHFWDWDDFGSYLIFLILFISLASLITYLLLDFPLYVDSLGFIAVLTESMLGVPQLLRNYTKKSTKGMSVEMIIMWLSGDLFKTLYFILRKTPVQFYICGSIQVLIDVLIIIQVVWYRRQNVTYRKLPKLN